MEPSLVVRTRLACKVFMTVLWAVNKTVRIGHQALDKPARWIQGIVPEAQQEQGKRRVVPLAAEAVLGRQLHQPCRRPWPRQVLSVTQTGLDSGLVSSLASARISVG